MPAVSDTLGLVLRGLGAIYSGPAERAAWRERPAPDLVVLAPEAARAGELAGLEHSLEFLLGVPHAHSGAAGVLWVVEQNPEPVLAISSRTYLLEGGQLTSEIESQELLEPGRLEEMLLEDVASESPRR